LLRSKPITNAPHKKHTLDCKIDNSLVKLAFDVQPKSLAAITVNSSIIVAVQWISIAHPILLLWLTTMLGITIWRWQIYRAFCRESSQPIANIHYWKRRTIIGAALSGLIWGSAAFLLVPVDNVIHQAVVIAVLIVMSAGSVVTLGSVPIAAYCYLSLVLVPLVIRMFTLGNIPSSALGVMTILFAYIMYNGVQHIFNTLVTTLKIRHEQEIAKEIIQHQAYHDELTGMPNRRLLLERLKVEIARTHRHGHIGALLFLDLDNFKTINDSLGHQIGDSLLVQLGERMTKNLRDADTAARLGGDEFIFLLSNLGENPEVAGNHASIAAKHLQSILSHPFDIEGHHLHISFSIGIALFPTHGDDPFDLLKYADSAMYQAKSEGRSAVRFFVSSMQEAADSRLRLEKELHLAIEREELCLHYQILKSFTGEIVGAEALLRWQHPHNGMVMPAAFIPIAEESGLIRLLGKHVVRTACRQLNQLESDQKLSNRSYSRLISARKNFPTIISLLIL